MQQALLLGTSLLNSALLVYLLRCNRQLIAWSGDDRRRRALLGRFGLDLETVAAARDLAFLSGCAYYDDEARVVQSVRAHFVGRVGVRLVRLRKLASGAVYVAVALSDGRLLIAVRGTNDANDWFSNANVISLNLFSASTAETPSGVGVHKGWSARAETVYADVMALGLIAGGETAPTRLQIGGHSMGGAVSSIVAVLIAERARFASPIDILTFGAPPIAGSDVVHVACLENAHRFVRPGDVAARPFLTFVQHGVQVDIEPSRFRCTHTSSNVGQLRAASAGGALKTAQQLRALGTEPHEIRGYFKDIDRLFAMMTRGASPRL
jgi:hypothetical protein